MIGHGGDRQAIALDDAIKALERELYMDWYDVPSDEMTLEQARQAVKDLRKKLAEYLEQNQNMVHVETLDQVMWERDIAISQLKELGYGLGEKLKTEQEKKTDIAKIEEDIQDYKDTFRSREKTVDEVLDDVLDIISKYRE